MSLVQTTVRHGKSHENAGLNAPEGDEGPPVVGELLHQLLPVAAGAQVGLVETPDVLNDFLSFLALLQRHILSDVSRNLGNVLQLPIQPLNKTAAG